MAIHELAGDAEQTAVRIEIPSKSGGIIFAQCVVLHLGDEVVSVCLPDGFRALAGAAGIDSMAVCWEGYLETLARIAFAKPGRSFDDLQLRPAQIVARNALLGTTFDTFTVVAFAGSDTTGKNYLWRIRCTCGLERTITGGHLKTRMVNCQCTPPRARPIKHGHARVASETSEYRSWMLMRRRCLSRSDPDFHRYGGRGISVAPQWQGPNGFSQFLADVGRKPATGLTLDRINNDGNYEPGNVRWATHIEQNRNRCDNRRVCVGGPTIAEAATAAGFLPDTVHARLKRGWSMDRALSEPLRIRGGVAK